MKKIALTGGTGFIGSHFLKQALDAGHIITAIRRSPLSTPRINLTQSPTWLDRQLYEVSANDLSGCDVLVHLAAHTGNVPYDTLSKCIYWNLTTVLALLEQARLAGIKRFVVAGSCFEYGRSGIRYDEIPTDAPLEPINSYAASKAAASIAIQQWAEEHQLSLEILRVFHVYGDGELETRFYPALKHAALNAKDFEMTMGEQIRDFQPVTNVARAFVKQSELDNYERKSTIFNLSSGNFSSLAEFAYSQWSLLRASGQINIGVLPYRREEVFRFVPGRNTLLI